MSPSRGSARCARSTPGYTRSPLRGYKTAPPFHQACHARPTRAQRSIGSLTGGCRHATMPGPESSWLTDAGGIVSSVFSHRGKGVRDVAARCARGTGRGAVGDCWRPCSSKTQLSQARQEKKKKKRIAICSGPPGTPSRRHERIDAAPEGRKCGIRSGLVERDAPRLNTRFKRWAAKPRGSNMSPATKTAFGRDHGHCSGPCLATHRQFHQRSGTTKAGKRRGNYDARRHDQRVA